MSDTKLDGLIAAREIAEYYVRDPYADIFAALDKAIAAERKSGEKGDGEISFQTRVGAWMQVCFGADISADREERNHRFLEEALELVQACGCTQCEAHQLVDYVYGRDQGDISQEVGGVMVTLAALCLANGFDMHAAGETELARIWTKIDKIRAKQAAKPRHSPLPVASPAPPKQPHGCPTDGAVEAGVSENIKLADTFSALIDRFDDASNSGRDIGSAKDLIFELVVSDSATILAALRAGPLGTFAEGLRAAAQWHFERRQGTPDAFEYEFHQVCGNSILGLAAPAKKGTEG
jgi:hypothetical protein